MMIERGAARLAALITEPIDRNFQPVFAPSVEPSIFGSERRLRSVRGTKGSAQQ
jgi:hypothetical protein